MNDRPKPKGIPKKLMAQLKRQQPRALDKLVHAAHDKAFSCINCLECANCCTSTGPLLTDTDIQRAAKHLRLKETEFVNRYVRIDEDGDQVFNSMPCPFLASDKHCNIYDHRPKACRDYPHTDRVKQYQLLSLHEKNLPICPAVEYVVEELAAKLDPKK